MILYFFIVWIVNMILYIKNTLIINDLCVYNLNCQYESSTIYKPMKTALWRVQQGREDYDQASNG